MNKPKFKSEKLEVNNFKGYVIDSGAQHFCINLDKIVKFYVTNISVIKIFNFYIIFTL